MKCVGKRKIDDHIECLASEWLATLTLSRTDSSLNRRIFWNVRLIPFVLLGKVQARLISVRQM